MKKLNNPLLTILDMSSMYPHQVHVFAHFKTPEYEILEIEYDDTRVAWYNIRVYSEEIEHWKIANKGVEC